MINFQFSRDFMLLINILDRAYNHYLVIVENDSCLHDWDNLYFTVI